MSKKVLAFGASNSRNSINKKFATFAANQLKNAEITILDLNDFEMPIYSIDRENESGIPKLAKDFKAQIQTADGIIISFAEHNGSFTVAYKNIYDWMSRLEGGVFQDVPMLLLATSPGGRGAQTVLGSALSAYQRGNKSTIASFSLPVFGKHFSEDEGIIEEELKAKFEEQLSLFEAAL